jgi:hypothetical protein
MYHLNLLPLSNRAALGDSLPSLALEKDVTFRIERGTRAGYLADEGIATGRVRLAARLDQGACHHDEERREDRRKPEDQPA